MIFGFFEGVTLIDAGTTPCPSDPTQGGCRCMIAACALPARQTSPENCASQSSGFTFCYWEPPGVERCVPRAARSHESNPEAR